jgi:ADP-ribosylglycohydrolase
MAYSLTHPSLRAFVAAALLLSAIFTFLSIKGTEDDMYRPWGTQERVGTKLVTNHTMVYNSTAEERNITEQHMETAKKNHARKKTSHDYNLYTTHRQMGL